jgi:hypothetical protein
MFACDHEALLLGSIAVEKSRLLLSVLITHGVPVCYSCLSLSCQQAEIERLKTQVQAHELQQQEWEAEQSEMEVMMLDSLAQQQAEHGQVGNRAHNKCHYTTGCAKCYGRV